MKPTIEKFIRYIAIEMALRRDDEASDRDKFSQSVRAALESAADKLAQEVASLEA